MRISVEKKIKNISTEILIRSKTFLQKSYAHLKKREALINFYYIQNIRL